LYELAGFAKDDALGLRISSDADAATTADGWLSLRVWEHDDPRAAAETVARAVCTRTVL